MELLENLKTDDIEGLKSVVELLKKDFYEEDHYVSCVYQEETGEDLELEKELGNILEEAKNLKIITEFKVEFEDGFDSPGYENSFLAYSFTDGTDLVLGTILLEAY